VANNNAYVTPKNYGGSLANNYNGFLAAWYIDESTYEISQVPIKGKKTSFYFTTADCTGGMYGHYDSPSTFHQDYWLRGDGTMYV